MKIVVTHNELENVANELVKENNELDSEINKILSNIERLEDAWEGKDKDISVEVALQYNESFVANSTNYLTHMKDIVRSLDEFAKFAKLSNNEYYDKDEEWQKNLEKANAELGKGEIRLEN